jgi:hypothetical protein
MLSRDYNDSSFFISNRSNINMFDNNDLLKIGILYKMFIKSGAITFSKTTLNIITFRLIINKMRHSAKWHDIVLLSVTYAECQI